MASPTAPVISSTGITAPSFAQIYAYLQSQYQAIFGVDTLVTPDTQDGQLLAVFAQAISDANSAAIAVYNSFSPATAQGVGLSSNVQINGLSRLVPSFSTAPAVVTGTPNAPITNGTAIDASQNVWALPPTVIVGPSGTTNVTVQCTTAGAIALSPNSLTINTPTFGWTGISNSTAALGAPVETDAELRFRQSQSVALPSQTIFEGIVAAIANTTGVTRVRGYENNTSSGQALPGGFVLPANNLVFIVEGGTSAAIFNAIFTKITPGIPTWNNGQSNNNSQVVTDANGSTRLINYQTGIGATVALGISIHPLSGWAASTEGLITAALIAYFTSLPIGFNISYFGLINVISLLGTPQQGTFEITGLTMNGGVADIQIQYNLAMTFGAANVTYILT